MVEKRASERKAARLKVRFWRAGEPDRVFTGYTSNISMHGCFIQTEHPIGTAARLQMELSADDHGFVCEGVVARSIKAPYELRQVKPSGMGVRFLSIEELLGSVLQGLGEASATINEALSHSGEDGHSSKHGTDSAPKARRSSTTKTGPATASGGKPDSVEARSPSSRRVARMHPAAAPRKTAPQPEQPRSEQPKREQSKAEAEPEPSIPTPDLAFRIAPPSLERLAALYHTELLQDHLFVPTQREGAPGTTVRVELVLPESDAVASHSVELYGVVQKQWHPDSSGSAPGQQPGLQGLGLKLISATSAKKTIGALVSSLK